MTKIYVVFMRVSAGQTYSEALVAAHKTEANASRLVELENARNLAKNTQEKIEFYSYGVELKP